MSPHICVAQDGQEAWKIFLKEDPDIIILDIKMPNLTGIEVCRMIRQRNKDLPIIIVTAFTNMEYFLEAVELNLTVYIIKPISMEALDKCLVCLNIYSDKQCDSC